MGGQGGAAGSGVIRAASVTEDPSKRRTNASPNNTQTLFLYVIPMMPPQIIEVFHAARRHPPHLPTLVTQDNPAKVGDTLILYATGLGPVRYQNENNVWVDSPIGQPFPPNTAVISPVTITIGNVETIDNDVLVLTLGATVTPPNVQGVEGFSNGYSVEFILPDFSPPGLPGTTTIQISSAWIQSAAFTLYVA
jgi:uncharacterized protein (TIGR03437 family)